MFFSYLTDMKQEMLCHKMRKCDLWFFALEHNFDTIGDLFL